MTIGPFLVPGRLEAALEAALDAALDAALEAALEAALDAALDEALPPHAVSTNARAMATAKTAILPAVFIIVLPFRHFLIVA